MSSPNWKTSPAPSPWAARWGLPTSGATPARVAPEPARATRVQRRHGAFLSFDWFEATPLAPEDAAGDVGRVRVRPIMAGARYTFLVGRLSIAPSLVAGFSFSSLQVAESGEVDNLSVSVSNSLAQ
ncbi:MAG: hypothetical protein R2712_28975 [Vicinamibacterales bacterium]